MYCTKCGSFLPEGAENCPNCNEAVNSAATDNNNYSNQQANSGVYYTPQTNANEGGNSYQSYYDPSHSQSYYQPDSQNYYQASQSSHIEQEMKSNLSTANTLGILAILLGIFFTPIAGIICGIIGLNKANNVPDMTMNPLIDKEKAKVKKLNILGIVIPIVLYIVAIIVFFVIMMVFGMFAASSALYY